MHKSPPIVEQQKEDFIMDTISGHIGEPRVMHSGRKCTIIGWRSAHDIDIILQTQCSVTARLHRRYNEFVQGIID